MHPLSFPKPLLHPRERGLEPGRTEEGGTEYGSVSPFPLEAPTFLGRAGDKYQRCGKAQWTGSREMSLWKGGQRVWQRGLELGSGLWGILGAVELLKGTGTSVSVALQLKLLSCNPYSHDPELAHPSA